MNTEESAVMSPEGTFPQGEQSLNRIVLPSEFNRYSIPPGFSFFEPYLRYHVKEMLEIGGEVYIASDDRLTISGLYIYDDYEKTGTIYARSSQVFEHFHKLKPYNFLFSELLVERDNEIYDIHNIELVNLKANDYRFNHEITLAKHQDSKELERFMASSHYRFNRRWVRVALANGEKCFYVRLHDEIAGTGWVSLVDGVGRLHSLFVKPQFRRLGIAEDILCARLIWLKSLGARSAFSEISRFSKWSSRIAIRAGMKLSGEVYLYFRKDNKPTSGSTPTAEARHI